MSDQICEKIWRFGGILILWQIFDVFLSIRIKYLTYFGQFSMDL